MSSKSKKSKRPASDDDTKLVQTRITPDDHETIEKMAKGSRLSMASMLRTIIASQADAYRMASSVDGDADLPSGRTHRFVGGVILSREAMKELGDRLPDSCKVVVIAPEGSLMALVDSEGELIWKAISVPFEEVKKIDS